MDPEKQLDDDNDGVPWASPEIRIAYEAALGRFVLAFNQLDNLLTNIVEVALSRDGRSNVKGQCTRSASFSRKLGALDHLQSSMQDSGLAGISIPAMKAISDCRNKVVHGHFDQNPFSGDYDIVSREERVTYSAADLDTRTKEVRVAWTSLRQAEAFYEFSDETACD